MSMKLDETLEIAAPAELVWQVIVDFQRYPEWNPFVVWCRSSLKPGEPIDMKVKLFATAQPQRETIFEHESGRLMRYGIPASGVGALSSTRSHEVRAQGIDTTSYHMHFELNGWLAPLVRVLLGRRMLRGFHGMSAGIKAQAEKLHQQRGS